MLFFIMMSKHLFLECKFAHVTWSIQTKSNLNQPRSSPDMLGNWLQDIPSKYSSSHIRVGATGLCWDLRLYRNGVVFHKIRFALCFILVTCVRNSFISGPFLSAEMLICFFIVIFSQYSRGGSHNIEDGVVSGLGLGLVRLSSLYNCNYARHFVSGSQTM